MDDKDDNSSIHSLSAGKLTMKDHSCSCNHSNKEYENYFDTRGLQGYLELRRTILQSILACFGL